MRRIREIYQRWLDGDLSQEDTLFAIGDLLDEEPSRDTAPAAGSSEEPVVIRESA